MHATGNPVAPVSKDLQQRPDRPTTFTSHREEFDQRQHHPVQLPENATGTLEDAVRRRQQLGMVPVPPFATVAEDSSAVVRRLIRSAELCTPALRQGPRRSRPAINEANGCEYCLAAHTAIGKMFGLTGDQIRDARHGRRSTRDRRPPPLCPQGQRDAATRSATATMSARSAGAGPDDGVIAKEVVAEVYAQRLHELLQQCSPRRRSTSCPRLASISRGQS